MDGSLAYLPYALLFPIRLTFLRKESARARSASCLRTSTAARAGEYLFDARGVRRRLEPRMEAGRRSSCERTVVE